MKKSMLTVLLVVLFSFLSVNAGAQPAEQSVSILSAGIDGDSRVELRLSDNGVMVLDFYADHIFRLFQDNSGQPMRNPVAQPPAQILLDNPRVAPGQLIVADHQDEVIITTPKVEVRFDKETSHFKVKNLFSGKTVIRTTTPVLFEKTRVQLTLKGDDDEYFYGGGVQNGRFSHKGKVIAIENQNSWTDGGVASPTPYYWSTGGYAFMWHTFKKGFYDFGSKDPNEVVLSHDIDYLDVFFMVNDGVVPLLNDFYQLTGKPVLIPKMGFYQGHLNAYNRDYWVEDENGILFEDGKRYKENQKDNGGVQESLNGELPGNYQFSARAVVDRYANHDMPLGWILPNDGYGAGYGQTETLEGNIQNLKEFGDYSRSKGVEIGLWTQSDLHPKEGVEALLQRDIINEVGVAGVRVLKTDVAWVGAGYSFGLNGVQDVATIMPKHGNNARPFIISLDGWAGTQHYATIWTGDQTGGNWEYIRFHIPTYLGSGLSGQPNISSDMDGIFGGKNVPVNIRDFQWKTFSLMQLNMDGWGSNEKYPHALGEPATSINRNYLKLKSELLPYAYSIAHESVDGLPSIRAMFLEEENAYTLGKNTQYQFMYGPNFLVAPIYQDTQMDTLGNDLRNHIYLPKGEWVDYFSGQIYEGGRIINNFDAPIWKLPVFVKNGAIIPMVNPNNNPNEIDVTNRIYEVYPYGNSEFTDMDDDGATTDYLNGEVATTKITSSVVNGRATISVQPTKGNFNGFEPNKSTEFRVNLTQKPTKVKAKVGRWSKRLKEVHSAAELAAGKNVYFYDAAPDLNRFATEGSEFASVKMIKNPQLLVKVGKTNTAKKAVILQLQGFEFAPENELLTKNGSLQKVQGIAVLDSNKTAYTLKPTWNKLGNADYYELELDGMLYSTVVENNLLFENLQPETNYDFKLRAVNKDGVSEWSRFSAETLSDPLEFAIRGITGESSADMQGGQGMHRLFDFDEGNMMHTKYGEKAVPFEMVIDLNSINQLDKMLYLPRDAGTNGMFTKGKIYYSNDKNEWEEAGSFEWKADFSHKEFEFEAKPTVRYVKIEVSRAIGDFGSGRELYIFKVPGTESYLPGDINNDKVIDQNDLTSYMNYTGLRLGDGDFEGYVSRGDVNKNNLIDAFDISNAAIKLDGGVSRRPIEKVSGTIEVELPTQAIKAGETVEIVVRGKELVSVNALGFAIPYNANDFDFAGVTTLNMKAMQNFTNDRLHTDGEKVLYPTFINVGNQDVLEGDVELFVIKLRAKRNVKPALEVKHGLLVDKNLNTVAF